MPPPIQPLERVQCKVPREDYHYIFHVLGGGVHGVQQHVMSHLFSAFTSYIRTLNLTPYHDRPSTSRQLRNLASIAAVGVYANDRRDPDQP